MKFLFANAPIDEEAIRQDIAKYISSDGLDMDALHKIHNEMGVDHSSVYVNEALKNCTKNKSFIDELEASQASNEASFEIAVIPTMFYEQHPEIGGNGIVFSKIAERLGIPCETIPVKSLGSVSENAQIIVDYLESRENSKPLWLLSMSKGTADLKCAFSYILSQHSQKSIKGILNVSGMQGGTLLTAGRKGKRLGHALMKSWLKIRGANVEMLKEMHKSHPYSISEFKLDKHIEVINVFGLPLLSHLRKPITKTYEYLSQFGPNDGYVLTEDALIPSSKNILFWGADHYLRVPEMNMRAEQVLNWINQREAK